MRLIKKYLAILALLTIFPIVWAIGKNFVTEAKTDIYAYIPQESDIVIEVNSRNFISEIMFQRIYNEQYVLDKVELEEQDIETGINYFSKVVMFREEWANEFIWIAIVGVNNKSAFTKYAENNLKDPHIVFGDEHAIIQLSQSANQVKMDEHLNKIANRDIKPFTARVNLAEIFKRDKEVNCYIIPHSMKIEHQIIDGFISFDFHQDHIDIDGEFNTVAGFSDSPKIAYPINEDAALSFRTSLNIFNSIWWFSKEKIEDVPRYDQMSVDYNGTKFSFVNKNWGYPFPLKIFPEVQLKMDFSNEHDWQAFLDTIAAEGKVKLDTTVKNLVTEQGAFLSYNLTSNTFELGKGVSKFVTESSNDTYFDFLMRISPLIDGNVFVIDEQNPPSNLEANIGMMVANEMMEDMEVFSSVEEIRFRLKLGEQEKLKAEGKIQMKNREGQSIVEGLNFMTEALFFVQAF